MTVEQLIHESLNLYGDVLNISTANLCSIKNCWDLILQNYIPTRSSFNTCKKTNLSTNFFTVAQMEIVYILKFHNRYLNHFTATCQTSYSNSFYF
jgi:hypothetical protein